MRTSIQIIAAVLVMFVAATVTADPVALTGRDVAREGSLMDLSGSLVYRDNEWFLDARDGQYEVHMGPFGHDESLPFAEGVTADIRGFVLPEHIAPIRVTIDGETYEFWHEQRYPLWAGTGERRNAVEERGDDESDTQGRGLRR